MKYQVCLNEKLYYLMQEVEANSPEEAQDKVFNMFENGELCINDNECEWHIQEVNGGK